MEKYLMIDENGLASVITRKDDESKFDFWYGHIGCNCVDIVDAQGIRDGSVDGDTKYCLVLNDSGWLEANAKVNSIASLLYGYMLHKQGLPNKVIVAKNKRTDDGLETVGLNDEDIAELHMHIHNLINEYISKEW